MTKLTQWIDRIRWKRRAGPVIMTQWGPVTESARKQAAVNIGQNPALKAKVEDAVTREMGLDPAVPADRLIGVMECKRRYFEGYQD